MDSNNRVSSESPLASKLGSVNGSNGMESKRKEVWGYLFHQLLPCQALGWQQLGSTADSDNSR